MTAPRTETVPTTSTNDKIRWLSVTRFAAVHVAAVVGVILLGPSWTGLVLMLAVYVTIMFGIGAGLHRYFSHRSFKTSRMFQFVLALLGTCALQKGVLWWSAHHRRHHQYSDEPDDAHSPRQRGFLWAHLGWIFAEKNDVIHWDEVGDLAAYPELRWLQRYDRVIAFALGVAAFLVGGFYGLVWCFLAPLVLLYHGTYTVNSICHIFGRQRYATGDDSRNNPFIAMITLGEGWHNNHHHYQRSAAQGFYWWEFDVTYYVLRGLQAVGLVWGVTRPPLHVRDDRSAHPS